jgi:hypothetical protein
MLATIYLVDLCILPLVNFSIHDDAGNYQQHGPAGSFPLVDGGLAAQCDGGSISYPDTA